ncbi:group-specific protein [Paenibacillus agilis]|uniref:Group-specific protein n=1 Tax=Paenibacillus agilis TaxID=3020863 RepID=A0A559IZH6_9BACL|nr:group-specific protein [Paenibacillus agilis]TVX93007.1 group-specific protein [Paenibacillus agilis]
MLSINIDEAKVKELCRERISALIQEVESDYVFWDRNELERRTCMSWPFIQQKFFYDPRFSKFKVGTKWLFPAKETRDFLLVWLSEQSTS